MNKNCTILLWDLHLYQISLTKQEILTGTLNMLFDLVLVSCEFVGLWDKGSSTAGLSGCEGRLGAAAAADMAAMEAEYTSYLVIQNKTFLGHPKMAKVSQVYHPPFIFSMSIIWLTTLSYIFRDDSKICWT